MILSEQNRARLDQAFQERKKVHCPVSVCVDGDSTSSESSDSEPDTEGFRRHAIVHIDDDTDEDLLTVLLDPMFGDGFRLSNEMSTLGTDYEHYYATQLVHVVKQSAITTMAHHPNRQFAEIIHQLYEELRVRLLASEPCVLGGIRIDVQLPHDYEVQVRLVASVLRPADTVLDHTQSALHAWLQLPDDEERVAAELAASMQRTNSTPHHHYEQAVFRMDDDDASHHTPTLTLPLIQYPSEHVAPTVGGSTAHLAPPSVGNMSEMTVGSRAVRAPRSVLLTTLFTPPAQFPRVEHLGRFSLHFVKEAQSSTWWIYTTLSGRSTRFSQSLCSRIRRRCCYCLSC
jgi:hypothetical protein